MRDFVNQYRYYNKYIIGSWFYVSVRRDSSGMLMKAFMYACDMHDGQMRRVGQEPYFAHCFRVAEKYAETMPADKITIDGYCAALLHDVKEDKQLTNANLIAAGFTPRCVELVAGMTRHPWETRQSYMERILESGDVELMVIKLADTQDNMNITPFNLDGFKDWRASYDRYSKNYIKLINAISKHLELN